MNYHILVAEVIAVLLIVALRITTLTAELLCGPKESCCYRLIVRSSGRWCFSCYCLVAIVVIASVHGSGAWSPIPALREEKSTTTCEQSEPRPRSWFPDWERDIGLGSRTGKEQRWRMKSCS